MVSKGQTVVERLERWIAGYMAFDLDGMALVAALWALHTWVTEKCDATPYLSITAATSQAGKTRLLTLLSFIARTPKMFANVTPAYLFTWMEQEKSKVTLFVDEGEQFSGNALGVMRSLMNTGYLQGQTIGRKNPDGSLSDFPVFCSKAFACIGDVNPTLRSRSIVFNLRRGKPAQIMGRVQAMGEATELVEAIRSVYPLLERTEAVNVEFLELREQEIWSAVFGVAKALGCDAATTERLTRCAALLSKAKTAPARKADKVESEDDATNAMYAEQALRDLRSVLREGEPMVFTAVALERLAALPTGGWAAFKGDGLNADTLSLLVSRFGVKPRLGRMATGKGASKAEVKRGYRRDDLVAALGKL